MNVQNLKKAKPESAPSVSALDSVKGAIAARKALESDIEAGLVTYREALDVAGEASSQAFELVQQPAKLLYFALSREVLSKDEVSESLGKVFGFKTKADGTESKTPLPTGERIRKRVVQASQAYAIATGALSGDDLPRWAEGIDAIDIAATVEELESDSEDAISVYTACDKLADMKSKRGAVSLPFDAVKLAKLAKALVDPVERAKIAESEALREAYLAIAKALPIATGGADAGKVDWDVQF